MIQNFLRGRSGGDSKGSSGETWILGTRYGSQQKERVRRHTASLIRLTYRNKFPAMQPYTDVTSDTGWGCMLRTAQMLMAQAQQRDMLGRDWRIPTNVKMLRFTNEYREIVKWFLDYPGPPYVYSLHHLVQCGMRYDKLPGEWYGPSTAAHVLKDLAAIHRRIFRGHLEVCVAQDGIVYKSEVERICTAEVTAPSHYSSSNSLSGLDTPGTKGVEVKDDLSLGSEKSISPPTMDVDVLPDKSCPSGDAEDGKDISHEYITEGGESFVGSVEKNAERKLVDSEPARLEGLCGGRASSTSGDDTNADKGLDTAGLSADSPAGEDKLPSTPIVATRHTSKGSLLKQRSIKGKSMYAEGLANPLTSENKTESSGHSKADPIDVSAGQFDPLFNPPPTPPKAPWSSSLMLVVPLRLGKDTTDPENIHAIKSLFRSKYTLGIMGGWVGHAVFFVGYRGDKLLGLDPHVTYECPAPWHSSLPQDSFPSDQLLEQIHVEDLQEMEFSQLDPSVAISFYFRDRDEFDSFCKDKSDHAEVLQKYGPSGAFGSGIATRPLNPTVAAAAGPHRKKPFDIVVAAKHHYFSLFGIVDVMPVFDDSLGESIGGSRHREDWELDSHDDDDSEDDEFVIV